MILKVLGVEVGTPNRSKIQCKTKSTSEGILASIFDGFWGVLGGKLGGKIKARANKKPSENASKKPKNDENT